MLFPRKGNPLRCPELSLCGQVLEQVECFKYLGVLLTSYLTWSKHTESNCAKAKKHLGRIYRCFSEMLIQIPTLYCTCMKAWFDLIWSMLPKYGTHTSKRISICLRELCSGCVARTTTMRIYFRVFNCLNCQQGDFISDCH